jgi:hypothetical protein
MKKRFKLHVPAPLSIKSPEWVFDELVKDKHIHLCKVAMYIGDEPFLPSEADLTPTPVDLDAPVPQMDRTQVMTPRFVVVAKITAFTLEEGQLYADVETVEGFSVESPNWEAVVSYTPKANNPMDCATHVVLKNIGGDDLFALSDAMLGVADVAP